MTLEEQVDSLSKEISKLPRINGSIYVKDSYGISQVVFKNQDTGEILDLSPPVRSSTKILYKFTNYLKRLWEKN